MAAPASADTLAARIEQLAPDFEIVRPEGDGPFPVVVMLHGCGGRQPFLDRWADVVAREAGAASLIVDSFRSRRISRMTAYSTVCTGLQLRGRERAGDLFAAMAWLREQDWANKERVIAAGWSHGGWTIIDALALRSGAEMERATGLSDLPKEPLEGVVGAFFAYPYAGRASFLGRRPWRFTPDSVAILAEDDYVVGVNYPRQAFHRQRLIGAPVEIHEFSNATHAFDVPEAIDVRVRYDPDVTRRAEKLLIDLIGRVRTEESVAAPT